jgi:DNA polymerase III delta subunit, C-terminal domain
MITIIHGNDTTQSRKYFLGEKQKSHDAVLLDADQVNLTDLAQILEGGGLFSETKYIFIEQLLTKRKKSAELKDILIYLEKHASEHTIILWEGKELEKSTLNTIKKAAIRDFKLPQTLFQFLDAIKPHNNNMLIKLFHQTITTTEPEMVFFMLVRQFRILLALAEQTNPRHSGEHKRLQNPDSGQARITEQIDELKRMAPWQKSKLESQAKSFEITHLLDLYEKLFTIEVGQKTGTLTLSLISAIDFFLLEV